MCVQTWGGKHIKQQVLIVTQAPRWKPYQNLVCVEHREMGYRMLGEIAPGNDQLSALSSHIFPIPLYTHPPS